MKTGSLGRPWVYLERPKPPPVEDRYRFWIKPPAKLSPRCVYWRRQIERGWLPNSRILGEGYDGCAQWFGVYIWEWLNVLWPLISERIQLTSETVAPPRESM